MPIVKRILSTDTINKFSKFNKYYILFANMK